MSRAEKKNVPFLQAHPLKLFYCFNFLRGYRHPGLQPLHISEPWDVEQNSPSNNPVRVSSDVHQRRAPRGYGRGGFSVVQLSLVSNMAQRVDVGSRVTVKFGAEVISCETWLAVLGANIMNFHHVVHRRARIVGPGHGVDWQRERHSAARLYKGS